MVPLPCIPLEAALQADMFAEMLVAAYKNPSEWLPITLVQNANMLTATIDIDSKRLANALFPKDYGTKQKREDELLRRFPTLPLPYIMKPSVLVDNGGVILAWSLAGVLSPDIQVCPFLRWLFLLLTSQALMWNSLSHINGMLAKSTSPDWLPEVSATLKCLNPDPSIPAMVPLPCIPLEAALQADMFAEMLVTAYKNPSEWLPITLVQNANTLTATIDIDSKRLANALFPKDYGTKQKREDELLRRFPTLPLPYIMKPSVLVDNGGVILAWSLAGVLSPDIQVCPFLRWLFLLLTSQALMWNSLSHINGMLAKSTVGASSRSNWRNTEAHFKDTDLEGCLNFSPGWFQQGRSISAASTSPLIHP
ncbi:hypothetical protein PAXINDRAFT_18576 [Paxillus involutus ATCC 200175]|uniref:Uncharacterized protein n=1 Tax=Paxillus involutus ATCC 200175 TaxID=664439 RepID=A0A0C9SYP7_PAXIN|nr:hypothetical protein PAXINDRAFT_18576 [Paxillus involutus ATCC 200175]